ncbi:hypothetical protein [Herpetosiphon geysericola]|uniref:DUF551 domain-containing protein n=1 Tax=Herpetosiphon geysericola TaxID=70996 RepID=A0A0P6YJV1_9CHLR|nr:hypothetical protein [Herpetosiphon geysericola]KPL90008.1 hypothetical protein SE18_08630 [Herpetosiphon geysericola]
MSEFFTSDEWQAADWLNALDRLAPAPALEPIPTSSKMLDAAPKPVWGWPMPRTFSDDMPESQEIMLVWHDQQWQPCMTSVDRQYYYLLGDKYEERYAFEAHALWLPLPHAMEVQA